MIDRTAFADDGYLVLRGAIDPDPLRAEVATALEAAFAGPSARNVSAEAGIAFRYVPTMVASTPVSLGLLHRFADVAAELLGTPVLPVRAKAVEYHGASGWHRDSELPLASVGFLAYLDALTAATGALRVVPGSHRVDDAPAIDPAHAIALETEPGDVVVLDEHLLHASSGGAVRLQWRVDFVARPQTVAADELARRYYAEIFDPEHDGGYDLAAYPSYGPDWVVAIDPSVRAELERLGARAAAEAQERAARARRGRR